MHKTIILALMLLINLLPACKKDKAGGGPDNKETKITTMELASTMEKKVTLTFQQFNDANYRAFARLKDGGTYVYGEVKYFASA